MNREEFEHLEEIEQLSQVLSAGILLSQNRMEDAKFFLYGMGRFYVILCFDANTDELKSLISCNECSDFLVDFPEKEKFFDPASRPKYFL